MLLYDGDKFQYRYFLVHCLVFVFLQYCLQVATKIFHMFHGTS